MFKLALCIDEIVKLVLIFFISIVFYRATQLSFSICLILSSITTILIGIFLFYFKLRKSAKLTLKNEQIKKIESIETQFSNASKLELRKYFSKLLSIEPNSKGELIFKTEDNQKKLYIPFFHKKVFDLNDLLSIYRINKNRKIDEIIIMCANYNDEAIATSKNYKKIRYTILSLKDIYIQMIETSQIFPEITVETTKKEKMTLTKLKKYAFERKRSKSYFFCGIILLLSSYFVPLRIYYLIFSGLMFVSSLLCIILNKQKIDI